MLTIYILNVGHGDSIVIKYASSSGVAFGVIDSNRTKQDVPPALKKLKELKANTLSFVALTHPHKDHYKGLLEILKAYKGKIDRFYTFPLDHHKQGRLKELSKIYTDIYKDTDSSSIRSSLKEFVQILFEAKNSIGIENWEEPEGFFYRLAPLGFEGIEFAAILPPKREKGTYFQMIETGSYEIVNRVKENKLSLAFSLRYRGNWLILGGDATIDNWRYRKRIYSERNGEVLESNIIKLPHHGANEDCQPSVIDYLFAEYGERIACISADGRYPHPHPDVFDTLENRGIKPFCTNLSDRCGEKIADNLVIFAPHIEPSLLRFLSSVKEDRMVEESQPCQGDIKIQIDDKGILKVIPQYDLPCPYRKGYDFLL